jgi:dTDP-4-amino-4,6-dideoxygalactose transaminase
MKKIGIDGFYIGPDAARYVQHVLDACIEGKRVDPRTAFEKKMKEYLRVDHAYACTSGTNALHMALLSLNISAGKEIITNPLTNIATISAILKCGCIPVFPRVLANGFFDMQDLKKRINKKTVAVIPVHLNGYAEDLQTLAGLARKNGLLIVEDACQALGTSIKIGGVWRSLGTIGDVGVYSFGEGKILCALGGGMIVTKNKCIAGRVDKLVGLGDYSNGGQIPGFNSRLDVLRSAIGLAALKDFGKSIEKRKQIWLRYQKVISKYAWVETGSPQEDIRINYSSFMVRVGSTKIQKILLCFFKSINFWVWERDDRPNDHIGSCSLDKKISGDVQRFGESWFFLPTHQHIKDHDIQDILSCFSRVDKILSDHTHSAEDE